ncbi:hypothetical protein bcCo53_000708 [Borrelia coriaceae]|uniref:Uncharacterized protein n=1 Tax=Borrelia coriaceae ATCC 43381 TaxID=1408429 RepID=W5SUM5_9SPIR|nr:hypothetical protein [Borrelia coriaceae]AHH10899.1 Hypothetical protein BCO_0044800 [Borrelia coriaceae ATCC 43381]UPA16552.1 hypothetical protein bcCo53_000708 [Borrelia coriaceae]
MNKSSVSIYDSIEKLSKDARAKLIREIKKNLSLNSSVLSVNNSNYLDSDSDIQIDDFLSKKFMEESFWIKIWVYILSFFQRDKTKEDIYKLHLLKKLEDRVNNIYKNPVVDFKKGYLRVGFVEMFFELYCYFVKLKRYFKMLDTGNIVEQAMFEIIQSKIPNAKCEMEDFLEFGEYERFLKKEKSQNGIEDAIKIKISDYIGSIPLQTYAVVEEMFEFFYVLDGIAFFPYKSFFSFFNIELLDDVDNFDVADLDRTASASFESVNKYFKCFFELLHTLRKVEINEEVLKIIVKNYFLIIRSNEDGLLSEESLLGVDAMFKDILGIMIKIIGLSKTLPYLDVFKIYYENPVLEPKKHIPCFDIKSFHENVLFLNVTAQIVKNHEKSLKGLMNRELKDLIENYDVIMNLDNVLFKGMELEYSNLKKLYFLNEFFKDIYDVKIAEILKTVNNVVLVNSTDLRSLYIKLEKNIGILRKKVYDLYFELNYKNEEYEKYSKDYSSDDSYRDKILEWCLKEADAVKELVFDFMNYFVDLKEKYIALLENNNAFIQSALNISHKLSTETNSKLSLSCVIDNVLFIIKQALFILENL